MTDLSSTQVDHNTSFQNNSIDLSEIHDEVCRDAEITQIVNLSTPSNSLEIIKPINDIILFGNTNISPLVSNLSHATFTQSPSTLGNLINHSEYELFPLSPQSNTHTPTLSQTDSIEIENDEVFFQPTSAENKIQPINVNEPVKP